MEDNIFEPTLSDPVKIMGLEPVEFVLVMVAFFLGLFATLYFLIGMVLLPWGIISLRKKTQRGYLKHLLYAVGLSSFKYYPISFEREFIE